MNFTKMHGLGNDFILIDGITRAIDEEAICKAAVQLCDRHFGIGGDGVILALPSDTADIKMRIINSDGSEPEMCGNGIRCFAKYVVDNEILDGPKMTIETLAGPIIPEILSNSKDVANVKVDMGEPILNRHAIPISGVPNDSVIAEAITVSETEYEFTAVSMGNPHAVVFVDQLEALPFAQLGPEFGRNAAFPEGINTEFVEINSPSECTMKVWERGAGPTLACGTGACAIGVAGVLNDKMNRQVRVNLPGGPLDIDWDLSSNHVFMTGSATLSYTGTVALSVHA
ncbi:diaminopimelate epimerase [bacterium]|nr:diaminopimelate epimerase [bacterium]